MERYNDIYVVIYYNINVIAIALLLKIRKKLNLALLVAHVHTYVSFTGHSMLLYKTMMMLDRCLETTTQKSLNRSHSQTM